MPMNLKLNSHEQAIKTLLGVTDDMALKVYREMQIDFSEASQEAIDAETRLAYEVVVAIEAGGITF